MVEVKPASFNTVSREVGLRINFTKTNENFVLSYEVQVVVDETRFYKYLGHEISMGRILATRLKS